MMAKNIQSNICGMLKTFRPAASEVQRMRRAEGSGDMPVPNHPLVL